MAPGATCCTDGDAPHPAVHEAWRAIPFGSLLRRRPLLLGEWTRDGASVLFAATDVLPNGFVKAETDVWAVPAAGGEAYGTGIGAPGLRDIRPNPVDGRVAYTRSSQHLETWMQQRALRDEPAVR